MGSQPSQTWLWCFSAAAAGLQGDRNPCGQPEVAPAALGHAPRAARSSSAPKTHTGQSTSPTHAGNVQQNRLSKPETA